MIVFGAAGHWSVHSEGILCPCPLLFKLNNATYILPREIQWHDADDTERTVYQTPEKGNSSDRPADKGQRDDKNTRDHPELDHPDVSRRIAERANKCDSDHNVREREPIGTIEEERIPLAGFRNSAMKKRNPLGQPGSPGFRHRSYARDLLKEIHLSLDRKGRESTEQKPNDKEPKQELNPPAQNVDV